MTYTYDANGNRTALGGTWGRTGLPTALVNATYNAANHQLTFGSTTLTYDLNGNLTGDGTNTYTWDARNRLMGISGGSAASFQYDGQGRRISKTINGAQTGFLYDGLNPVQELNGSTVIANLLTGLGIDQYLTRTDAGGASHFLSDGLGSTLALSDATGALTTSYTYSPFGATSLSGSATGNAFDYTGREDDITGLKYYRARYYHPGLQRFISEDPLEFGGGDVNLYNYVANAPAENTDPTGEFLLAGCVGGAGFSLAMDVGTYLLSGRKSSLGEVLGNALIGCASGAIGGFIGGHALKAVARVGQRLPAVTGKGLARIGQHLNDVAADQGLTGALKTLQSGERAMLERLRAGMRTRHDIEFYLHELKESAAFRATGDLVAAHQRALAWRGATSKDLFHPSVVNRFREIFTSW